MAKHNIKHLLKAAHYAEEPETSPQHNKSFMFQTETSTGFVFGVVSAYGNQEVFEAFADTIGEHLERLSETINEGANLAHRFEQLLQAINEAIATSYEEGTLTLRIADAASIIGVADDTNIITSGFGNLSAMFLHKTEKERYAIYDLARGMRVEDEAPTWNKTFLSVLDGDLHPNDVLYIGTRINRHDLPPSTLNEIITTLPPNSAINKIRQYLPIETVFAAVILRADRIDELSTLSTQTPISSIKNLGKTASKTEKLLGEQKPELKSIAIKIWRIIFPKQGSESRSKFAKKVLRILGKLLVTVLLLAGNIVLGAFISVFNLVKKTASDPKRALEKVKKSKQHINSWIENVIKQFNNLPKMSKYILLAVFLVLFIFIVSIVFINKQKTREAVRETYNIELSAIETKIENAEASLIYGDEDQARTLLAEAKNLLTNLPTESTKQEEKVNELTNTITQIENDLSNIDIVDALQLGDAANVLDGQSARALTRLDDKTYLITDTGDIYEFTREPAALKKIEITKGEVGSPRATTTGGEAVYWLDDGLSRFVPETGNVAPLSVAREGIDLTYYARKIYILSPNSGQVYRHQPTANGFDGGSAWIISGVTSVADGVAITIDGYVWVLKSDGNILRYLSGKEDDWSASEVNPPLVNATDIWTDEKSAFLYILDPNEKRIVVFNKSSGSFLTQYTNEEFNDLQSMIVDESAKTITVLAGDKIYSFGMSHL